MTNVINFTKTAFTWSVVAVTILWSVGVSALAPVAASAADCEAVSAGELVKFGTESTVYVVSEEGALHYFDNRAVFFSWGYTDADIMTRDASCISSYEVPTSFPGVGYSFGLVKPEIGSTVYVVTLDGMMYSIATAADAESLWGAGWGGLMRGINNFLSSSYDFAGATELDAANLPDGMLISYDGAFYATVGGAIVPVEGDVAAPVAAQAVIGTDAMMAGLDTGTPATAGSLLSIVRHTDAEATSGGSSDSSDDTTTAGEVSVSLAASTPESQEVPKNAIGAVFTSIVVSNNGSEDANVTGLDVQRLGLGDAEEISKVYVEVDGVLQGSKRSLGSDNEANLSYQTANNMISVPAGSSVTLDIVADMDSSYLLSYGSHQLRVTALEADGADVTGSFPLTGNVMSRADSAVAAVEFSFTNADNEREVGDNGVAVSEFTIENLDSSANVEFTAVTLENDGTADEEEMSNFGLYANGEMIAGPVELMDDKLVFVLDETFVIEDGKTEDFEVRADIDGSGVTFIGDLDETSDLRVYEENTSYRAEVSEATGSLTETVALTGGDLTFNESDANPSAESLAVDEDDALFLVAEIKSEAQTLLVDSLRLVIEATNGGKVSDLENVRLVVDGRTVGGPEDPTATTTAVTTSSLTFSDDFEVSGVQDLYVYADVKDTASAGGKFVFEIAGAFVSAEELDGDAVASSDITGTATGKTQTIQSGDLTVTKDSSYGNATTVSGADQFLVGRYVLRAPTTESVELEEVVVNLGFEDASGGDVSASIFDNLTISIDNEEIGSPDATDLNSGAVLVTSSAVGSNSFNVNTTIDADTSIKVSVYLDVDSNITFETGDSVQTALEVQFRGDISDSQPTAAAVAGQVISLASGDLAVEVKNDPEADLVVANATNVEVARFEFSAENDAYTITDLDFEVSDDSVVTSLFVGDVEVNSFQSGVANFNNLNLRVEDDEDLLVKVYANFNNVDSSAATSGSTSSVSLVGYEADADAGEDKSVSTSSLTYRSQAFQLHKTQPTLVFTAGAQADASDELRSGQMELATISVTADSNGPVTLGALVYTLTGVNTSTIITSVELRDSSNNVVSSSALADIPYNSTLGAYVFDVAASDEEVAAGDTEVYSFEFVTTGVTDNDEIQIRFTNFQWIDSDDQDTRVDDSSILDEIPSEIFTANNEA